MHTWYQDISHLDRKTNVEVLEMVMAKQALLRTIQERKLQYFGHLIWGKGKQKLLMEGKLEGTRRREKQRNTWTCHVMDLCGMIYMKCVRVAESRKEWSSMAADLLGRIWHPQWQWIISTIYPVSGKNIFFVCKQHWTL